MKRLFLCALLLAACSGDVVETVEERVALPTPSYTPLVKVVPGPGFPAQVTADHSNNNLDIIDHEGRFFFAFRTGPDHFASDQTRMYIVSTTDEKTWTYETKLQLGIDVREPRFLSFKGRLFLYFASLGLDPLAFEPGHMYFTERLAEGEWSAPVSTFADGFIPWRIKVFDGKPIMIGYTGGEHIYDFTGKPLHIYLLTTKNGTDWEPLNPKREYVLESGGSETDIEFDDEGNLYAVVRNEAGDATGFGSKICRAPAADITDWTCVFDARKYDSPLLLKYGSEIYLIGRRNVTETGFYDLGRTDGDLASRAAFYQIDYWDKPKRCSLWHLDRGAMRVDFVLDFPSRGDTCFPSVVPRGENGFLLYNYSSDINGPDVSWHEGQLGNTYIYSTLLTFGY